MYPCSFSKKQHEATIFSAKEAAKSGFKEQYEHYISSMEVVAESAKIYILNNWKKVKNWTDLEISIVDNTGKETYYYNYVEYDEKYKTFDSVEYEKIIIDIHKRRKKLHNPVKQISDVVLDFTDGDFSLKINDKDHLWIDDESVIILANYIEQSLAKKKK